MSVLDLETEGDQKMKYKKMTGVNKSPTGKKEQKKGQETL